MHDEEYPEHSYWDVLPQRAPFNPAPAPLPVPYEPPGGYSRPAYQSEPPPERVRTSAAEFARPRTTGRPSLPAPPMPVAALPAGPSVPVPETPEFRPPFATLEDDDRDYPIVLEWTLIWYAIPGLVYLAWAILSGGLPASICANPVNGACPSPRSTALDAMWSDAPSILIAVLVSLIVAVAIRRASLSWRAINVGLAAGIVGAGLSTLAISIL